MEYEFELRELPGNGAAPQSAFSYSPVIYSERLHYTTLAYTAMHPLLDPGKTYGWRVQAIAKDGADEPNMFENSGFSEMRFFILRTDCRPPAGCTATVKDRSAELSWTSGAGNAEYVVQWRSESAVSPEWAELSVSDTRATLKNLQRNTVYEYRVGGMCEQGGQAVFSEIGRIDMGSRDRSNCGVAPEIDLSNRDPLPELKVGDEVMIGGDFPMTVTSVTGGSAGVFSGEGRTPVNWVFESNWAVAFDQLEVNTDYRQIGGTVRALYDKNRGMTGDLDAFTEGGTTPDTRNGIVMPDLELDFAIPENPQFTYHEETGELTVYTADGQEAGTVQMPKNEGKSVFPVVVKDKDGNLYKVEEESGETAGGGAANGEEKQLKATYIGKQTDPLPRLDNVNIAADVATVTFSKGAGKFAFDAWQDYYGSVSVIESKKVYEHLACGDRRYDVPWKLLPEGESDVVEAKIEIRDKSLDPEKVIFSTPQGTVYKHVYDQKKQTCALTLVAGADGDVQEIYALNKLSGASYQTLGKLNVITCRRQTPRVALVSVNDYTADAGHVKKELDRIYNPVGVTWEVAVDTFSYLADRDYFEKGSGLLKAYNEKMTALQNAYRAAKGGIEKNTCYVFVLNYSGGDNDRNTAGFMPRGKQFGYIFLSGISKNETGNVIAHELGHGLWKLKHTFDDSYGKTAAATEGTTDNLMDYNKGAHLAKWQWDVMREPAIFDGVLDSDEDAMMKIKEGVTEQQLRDLCYSYNLQEQVLSQSKYNHPYTIASTEHILQYIAGSQKETYIFTSREVADKVKNGANPLNYSAYSDDMYMGEGLYDKIITTLKAGETDACPAVFDRQDGNGFVLEFLRALRLSHKNNQAFKHDFGGNVSISLGSLTLPDAIDSANIKKGGKLTDVEMMVDAQSLSDININEYELQEERNYLSKNDKYLCLGKNGDEYAMKIKTNEDCFDVLFEYIYGIEAPEIITKDEVIDKFKTATEQSVIDAIKAVGSNDGAACNVCTRAAFYYLTNDPVLFPKKGSCLDEFTTCNSMNDNFLKGLINGEGSAKDIVSDLSNYTTNDLEDYFIEEIKSDSESYETFWGRLQNEVDRGEIIIGTYSTNHVFMIVPGGMIDVVDNTEIVENDNGTKSRIFKNKNYVSDPKIFEGDKWGYSFLSKGVGNIYRVPRILECGVNVKSSNAPIYANMDYKGSKTIKWFKYIKNK